MESPQVGVRPVLLTGLGCVLLVVFAIGMLSAVYYWQVPGQTFPAPAQFPEPRVQAGQREQLRRLQAEQNERLHDYRWIDRNNGVVQIPIERSMQLLAAEGAQGWAPLAPPQALSAPDAGAQRLITPQGALPATPGPGAGLDKPAAPADGRNAVGAPQRAAGPSSTAPQGQ